MSVHLKLSNLISQYTYISIKTVVHIFTLVLVQCTSYICIIGPVWSVQGVRYPIKRRVWIPLNQVAKWRVANSYRWSCFANRGYMALHFVHSIYGSTKFQQRIELFFKHYCQCILDGQTCSRIVGGTDVAIRIGQNTLVERFLYIAFGGIIHLKHMPKCSYGHILYLYRVLLHPISGSISLFVLHFALPFHANAIIVVQIA